MEEDKMISSKELLLSIKELRHAQKKTDEQMKKTDEQMKKTDEKLYRIGKLVGAIGNNQGDVAEEFFYNTLSANPVFAGVKYDFTDKNITRRFGDIEDEFDIVLVNGEDVAVIETKYKAHQYDLDRLVNKKQKNFKILYPQYKNFRHHFGLAAFNINDSVKNNALRRNIIVLQRKGDVIETTLP